MDAEQIEMLIGKLEDMGFSRTQASEAVYAGISSVEAAINWLFEHEQGDGIGAQKADVFIDGARSFEVSEVVKSMAQNLRNQALKRKEEEEQKVGGVEKGSLQLSERQSPQMTGKNQRKRHLVQGEADREEEMARERIRQKLQQDKLERLGRFGSAKAPPSVKPEKALTESPKDSQLLKPARLPSKNLSSIRDRMQECLRSLKRNTKNDHLKSNMAFQTLWIYVKNVASNPDEAKFRKIRIGNPVFQEHVRKWWRGVS